MLAAAKLDSARDGSEEVDASAVRTLQERRAAFLGDAVAPAAAGGSSSAQASAPDRRNNSVQAKRAFRQKQQVATAALASARDAAAAADTDGLHDPQLEGARKESKQLMVSLQDGFAQRQAELMSALKQISAWLKDADPGGAIDEERAKQIGAGPPGSRGGTRQSGNAFDVGGVHTLRRAASRRGGRLSKDYTIGDDASLTSDSQARPRPLTGDSETWLEHGDHFEFEPDIYVARLASGREKILSLHSRLVDSLEWAVQQRESAKNESEAMGETLAEKVVFMEEALSSVLTQVESDSNDKEIRAQRAENENVLLNKTAGDLKTELSRTKARLESSLSRIKSLNAFIQANNLMPPPDDDTLTNAPADAPRDAPRAERMSLHADVSPPSQSANSDLGPSSELNARASEELIRRVREEAEARATKLLQETVTALRAEAKSAAAAAAAAAAAEAQSHQSELERLNIQAQSAELEKADLLERLAKAEEDRELASEAARIARQEAALSQEAAELSQKKLDAQAAEEEQRRQQRSEEVVSNLTKLGAMFVDDEADEGCSECGHLPEHLQTMERSQQTETSWQTMDHAQQTEPEEPAEVIVRTLDVPITAPHAEAANADVPVPEASDEFTKLLKRVGQLQTQLTNAHAEIARSEQLRIEAEDALKESQEERLRMVQLIEVLKDGDDQAGTPAEATSHGDGRHDAGTADGVQATLMASFEAEKNSMQSKFKKERQRLAVVHSFELEGLRSAQASQLKVAEKRADEKMESERRAHKEHVRALEDAQRAKASREDALRAEMERLSDRIEELEAELDDQRVDFEKDMAEAIAAAKQSVEVPPTDRSAETTSCKTTSCKKLRRKSVLDTTPKVEVAAGDPFADGTVQEAMVEEAAAQEELDLAMKDFGEIQAASANENDDDDLLARAKAAETRLGRARTNIERATWKRMCREAQAENKLARAELQHVHVELGKAQEDNRTQQNARLTVESRLADALQDAKGAHAQLTALEKELRVSQEDVRKATEMLGMVSGPPDGKRTDNDDLRTTPSHETPEAMDWPHTSRADAPPGLLNPVSLPPGDQAALLLAALSEAQQAALLTNHLEPKVQASLLALLQSPPSHSPIPSVTIFGTPDSPNTLLDEDFEERATPVADVVVPAQQVQPAAPDISADPAPETALSIEREATQLTENVDPTSSSELLSHHEQMEKSLMSQLEAAKSESEKYRMEVSRLSAEMAALRASVAEQQSTPSAESFSDEVKLSGTLQLEIDTLMGRLDDLRLENHQLEETMRQRLLELEEQKDTAEKKAIGNRFLYSVLRARIRKAQSTFAASLEELREKAGQQAREAAAAAQASQQGLEDDLTQLRAQLTASRKHVELLEQELSNADHGKDMIEGPPPTLIAGDPPQHAGPTPREELLSQQMAERDAQLEAKEKILCDREGQIQQIQGQLDAARASYTDVSRKVEELTLLLADRTQDLETARCQARSAQRDSDDAMSQFRKSQQELALAQQNELAAKLARERADSERAAAQRDAKGSTNPGDASNVNMAEALRAKHQLDAIKPQVRELGVALQSLLTSALDPSSRTPANNANMPINAAAGGDISASKVVQVAVTRATKGKLNLPQLSPRGNMANLALQSADISSQTFGVDGAIGAITAWAQREDSSLADLLPVLKDALSSIGRTLSALTQHAKNASQKALEASHQHAKSLHENIIHLLARDEQLRRERSDAAITMLQTKMELVQLQQQLTQPAVEGDTTLDAAKAEEAMNSGGGVTRALHTLTQRMLDAQVRWEERKANIEAARSNQLSAVLKSLKNVLEASNGKPNAQASARVQRTEFMNRGSSVINRYLAINKNAFVPASTSAGILPGSTMPTPRNQPNNPELTPAVLPVQTPLPPNGPPPGKRPRAARTNGAARVKSGAGEAVVLQPRGSMNRLQADVISETAAMAQAGGLAHPQLSLAKFTAAGHDHILFDNSAMQGADFRRKFAA